MANVRNGNSVYIDSTGTVDASGVRVVGIVLTSTAANAVLVLTDNAGSPVNKCDLRVATSGESQFFDFSISPLWFPSGLKVGTLTNAKAMIVYTNGNGQS